MKLSSLILKKALFFSLFVFSANIYAKEYTQAPPTIEYNILTESNKNTSDREYIRELILKGARIIDVRTETEYNEGHYKNAENFPVALITSEKVDIGGDKNAYFIVYCASGRRSAIATKFLKSKGYNNIIDAGALGNMP